MKQVHHFNWKINIDVSFSVKYEFSSYNLSWYIEVKSFKVFFFLNLLIHTSTSTYNTRLTSELIEWDGVVFLKTSCGKGENNVTTRSAAQRLASQKCSGKEQNSGCCSLSVFADPS